MPLTANGLFPPNGTHMFERDKPDPRESQGWALKVCISLLRSGLYPFAVGLLSLASLGDSYVTRRDAMMAVQRKAVRFRLFRTLGLVLVMNRVPCPLSAQSAGPVLTHPEPCGDSNYSFFFWFVASSTRGASAYLDSILIGFVPSSPQAACHPFSPPLPRIHNRRPCDLRGNWGCCDHQKRSPTPLWSLRAQGYLPHSPFHPPPLFLEIPVSSVVVFL